MFSGTSSSLVLGLGLRMAGTISGPECWLDSSGRGTSRMHSVAGGRAFVSMSLTPRLQPDPLGCRLDPHLCSKRLDLRVTLQDVLDGAGAVLGFVGRAIASVGPCATPLDPDT